MRLSSPIRASLAAATILVIGMGIGRFAFTGLYPVMVSEHQITVQGGSYAASANYAGYLAGALLAGLVSGVPSSRLCAFSAITTTILLGLLGLELSEVLIVAVRGLAGVSSAIAMVAATHWLIHDQRYPHGSPILFAGVGTGILLSAELIAAAHGQAFGSRAIWLFLAVAALVLAVPALVLIAKSARRTAANLDASSVANLADDRPPLGATRLILMYGLAGFGYIITATYLPLLIRETMATTDPVHIWAVFGLGAIPSCFLWHALYRRWGTHLSLLINLLTQAFGVALPVMAHTPAAYIMSALLVGGTFMGTVTIAMPAARRVAGSVRFNILSIMTAAYGVGQILGPLVAGVLHAKTNSFDPSLAIAAVALLVATALCIPRSAVS
jgi:MFS family permease